MSLGTQPTAGGTLAREELPSLGRDNDRRWLKKGLEEEVYVGRVTGEVLSLSARVAEDLYGYTTEPDGRNVEFTTAPYRDYDLVIDRLMAKRCELRRYLEEKHESTLIPGATLSLAGSEEFQLSKPNNPYYEYIRDTYGTLVVTASTHINLGIDDIPALMRCYRVLRCEAAMYLALTAASPFLHGEATGLHSTRWHRFPETPRNVPFFPDHESFAAWVHQQIDQGHMHNQRHLWLSIRPNGASSPDDLNRLELRICDRISSPKMIRAVTALYEARVWSVLESDLDPLSDHSSEDLRRLVEANEASVAASSLEAEVTDWVTGDVLVARDWIERTRERVAAFSESHDLVEQMVALDERLEEGSPAMRWIAAHDAGQSIPEIVQGTIRALAAEDRAFNPACPSL